MIKQNGYWIPWKPVSFSKLTQSNFVPIQIHGQGELDWVSFEKLTGIQGIHFVCDGEGGMLAVGVCESKCVGALMRFEW